MPSWATADMRYAEPAAKPFALLARALKPKPFELANLGFTLIGVWICELAIPFLLGATLDGAVAKQDAFDRILRLGAMALVIAGALYVFHACYLRAETRLVARGTFRLRRHLYARLIEQPLSSLSGLRKGEIAQRLMSDTDVLDSHAIYLFADVPFSILTVIGIFAVMLWMQPVLALLVSGVLALVAILSHLVGRPLETAEKLVRHRWARLGGKLQETLDGFRAVKSFGREDFEIRRMDREGERLMRAEITAGKIISRLEPLVQLMTTAGFLAVVWYGAFLVYAGTLTPGKLLAFIAYMELMHEPVRDAGTHYAHYKQSAGTLARIASLVGALPSPIRLRTTAPAGPMDIFIQGVSYAYPGSDRKILDNVSISAKQGEIIALVGPNGAGKSTLLDILLGLLPADSGTVCIGDVDVEEWDNVALRSTVSALPQGVPLFHTSILENIRYGAPDVSYEEIEWAVEKAGLASVVARLPRGLQTIVGNRGESLSGGERQRVALARALVGKPRILVLDEPATALDATALPPLIQMLRDDRMNRLTFFVAHDPETVAIADRVIVLDRGRVTNICKPSELHSAGSVFCRFLPTAA